MKNNTKTDPSWEQLNIPWPLKRLVTALGSSLGFVVGAAVAAFIYQRLGYWPEKESILRTGRK